MEGSSVGNTSQFPVADKVLESGVDRAETWPERRAESTFVRLETIADRLASPTEISPDKAVFRRWFSRRIGDWISRRKTGVSHAVFQAFRLAKISEISVVISCD